MRIRNRSLGRFGVMVLVAHVSTIGWAGAARAEESPARLEANARFKAGLASVHQGKWEKARVAFLQAYAVDPDSAILWNLALAELKSGHAIEALQHFADFERDPKAEADDVAKLPMLRERAYQQIGRIKIEAPSGAKAWVDGGLQVATETALVMPGEHTVKVELGPDSEERHLKLSAGQLEVVAVHFGPAIADPASPALPAPSSPSMLPSPVAPAPEHAEPAASPDAPNRTLGWVGLGASVSALGVGVGFALAASSKANEARDAGLSPFACSGSGAPACSSAQDAANKHSTYTQVSAASFVAAGVLGVATAGYFLFTKRSTAGVSLIPYGSLHQAGIRIRGQF